MAKLNTSSIIITVSKLVKNSEPTDLLLTDEVVAQLEAIVSELVGDGVVVEIEENRE